MTNAALKALAIETLAKAVVSHSQKLTEMDPFLFRPLTLEEARVVVKEEWERPTKEPTDAKP